MRTPRALCVDFSPTRYFLFGTLTFPVKWSQGKFKRQQKERDHRNKTKLKENHIFLLTKNVRETVSQFTKSKKKKKKH